MQGRKTLTAADGGLMHAPDCSMSRAVCVNWKCPSLQFITVVYYRYVHHCLK